MQSSLIGKIEKAKRYAEEPERVSFSQFKLTFRGGHQIHSVSFDNGTWDCGCRFFNTWQTCSHTMAIERMLGVMVPQASPVNASEPGT